MLKANDAQLCRSGLNKRELPIERVGYNTTQGSRKLRKDRAMKLMPGGMVDMKGKLRYPVSL